MEKSNDIHDSTRNETVEASRRELVKGALILCSVMTIMVLAVVAFLSRAWFASNSKVDAEGMQIFCAGNEYELAVKKGTGSWDEKLTKSGLQYGTESGDNFTTGSNSNIIWSLGNTDDFANSANQGIDPGSYGKVTFYILPKKTGNLSITFRLQIDGWTGEDANQPVSGEVSKLLRGHVLLFAGFDAESNSYRGWISDDADSWQITFDENSSLTRNDTDGSLTWTGTVTENQIYPVEIYWIWPEVLGQYLFKDGTNIQHRRVLFPKDSSKNTSEDTYVDPACLPNGLFATMANTTEIENQSNNAYFQWTDKDGFTSNVTVEKLKNLRENYHTAAYNKICEYYNIADQTIGETVGYLTLRLDVQ